MVLFEKMRKFHNKVKLMYLNNYVEKPSKLLDLASGKGGDIFKWNSNKMITKVDGYDINTESVKEAIRRRKILKVKKRMNFNVLDLSTNVLNCEEKYDVITSMFAFHYFYRSPDTLKTIISTLKNCSKKGTILIMTMFDGNLLTQGIQEKNFYVKVDPSNDLRRTTGNKVDVFIKESVLDKPETEYLVIPSKLISTLKKIGFKLVEKTNFKDLYDDKYGLNQEEKKLSFLNTVYVFQKQ